jgi:hypothetical protein
LLLSKCGQYPLRITGPPLKSSASSPLKSEHDPNRATDEP